MQPEISKILQQNLNLSADTFLAIHSLVEIDHLVLGIVVEIFDIQDEAGTITKCCCKVEVYNIDKTRKNTLHLSSETSVVSIEKISNILNLDDYQLYEGEKQIPKPIRYPFPSILKDHDASKVISLPILYHCDGTGMFSTNNGGMVAHNIMSKFLPDKEQKKVENVYLISGMDSKIPMEEQLAHVTYLLLSLEKGFVVYDSFQNKKVVIVPMLGLYSISN
jgi:hypothetical protein